MLLDGVHYLKSLFAKQETVTHEMHYGEDDWQPAPTAIPFGPFLVAGFVTAIFWGETMTRAYIDYALRK